jgi:hypothetical protein
MITHARRTNTTQGVLTRGAKVMQNLVKLIDITGKGQIPLRGEPQINSLSTLEDGLAPKQLGEDTPNRPNID